MRRFGREAGEDLFPPYAVRILYAGRIFISCRKPVGSQQAGFELSHRTRARRLFASPGLPADPQACRVNNWDSTTLPGSMLHRPLETPILSRGVSHLPCLLFHSMAAVYSAGGALRDRHRRVTAETAGASHHKHPTSTSVSGGMRHALY